MSFYLPLCKDFMLIDLLGRSGGAMFLPYKALVLWDGGASLSSLSSGLG